jgi:hypothetical protein
VQRTFVVARLDLALGLARLLARELGRDRDERIETRLERVDPRETGLSQRYRRELAPADSARGLLER